MFKFTGFLHNKKTASFETVFLLTSEKQSGLLRALFRRVAQARLSMISHTLLFGKNTQLKGEDELYENLNGLLRALFY